MQQCTAVDVKSEVIFIMLWYTFEYLSRLHDNMFHTLCNDWQIYIEQATIKSACTQLRIEI